MRRIARPAVLLLAVVASLSGCTVTTAPSASPDRTSVVPTPSAVAKGSIEMGPKNTVVTNASGTVVATIRYDEDPRTAIVDLTTAIGVAPTLVEDPSDADRWGIGATDIAWKGLRLGLYERGPADKDAGLSIFSLTADAASVNGIPIVGPNHVAVGDTETEVAPVVDTDDPEFNYGLEGELPLAHWKRPGPNPADGAYLTDWIVAGTEKGTVTYLRATNIDYGS